ncbi:MAG: hypothetical protein M3P51_09950 [Chloroflexota bacterium]|nr:hypothetical protein [Chloroflexota bacterium]
MAKAARQSNEETDSGSGEMSMAWEDERDMGTTSAPWQRVADRLARYGWLVLLVAVVVANDRLGPRPSPGPGPARRRG